MMLGRMAVEWHWFGQFELQSVLLRRWGLQLVAFVLVFGGGSLLQLKQVQRCWRLRQEATTKSLSPEPLLRLGGSRLLLALVALLLLLATGLAYLVLQARDLIGAPFSGQVITGFSVLLDLPPLLPLGLAAGLLIPLLIRPLATLRITLAAALAASATALARGWSLWLPALLAAPFGERDPLVGLDLSFTVLRLPALKLLLSVLLAQGVVGLAACLLLCLSEGTSLSDGAFPGLSRAHHANHAFSRIRTHSRWQNRRGDCAQLRALRFLHCHLPHLPAVR
jgi:uncharacterized membrane protein (UPF0182 family)